MIYEEIKLLLEKYHDYQETIFKIITENLDVYDEDQYSIKVWNDIYEYRIIQRTGYIDLILELKDNVLIVQESQFRNYHRKLMKKIILNDKIITVKTYDIQEDDTLDKFYYEEQYDLNNRQKLIKERSFNE